MRKLALILLFFCGCTPKVSVRTMTGAVMAIRQPPEGEFCPHGSAMLFVAPGVKQIFNFDGPAPVIMGEWVLVTETETVSVWPFVCRTFEVSVDGEDEDL